jgi:hypothetical protein
MAFSNGFTLYLIITILVFRKLYMQPIDIQRPGLSSVSPDSATASILKYLLDDFILFELCISIIDLMFVK